MSYEGPCHVALETKTAGLGSHRRNNKAGRQQIATRAPRSAAEKRNSSYVRGQKRSNSYESRYRSTGPVLLLYFRPVEVSLPHLLPSICSHVHRRKIRQSKPSRRRDKASPSFSQSTRHRLPSRNTRNSYKTNDRIHVYPSRGGAQLFPSFAHHPREVFTPGSRQSPITTSRLGPRTVIPVRGFHAMPGHKSRRKEPGLPARGGKGRNSQSTLQARKS